jgi:hypothetical protein
VDAIFLRFRRGRAAILFCKEVQPEFCEEIGSKGCVFELVAVNIRLRQREVLAATKLRVEVVPSLTRTARRRSPVLREVCSLEAPPKSYFARPPSVLRFGLAGRPELDRASPGSRGGDAWFCGPGDMTAAVSLYDSVLKLAAFAGQNGLY